ncbi:MAG: methyltransferase domain-containing protein [Dehalococcoidia bacterium]
MTTTSDDTTADRLPLSARSGERGSGGEGVAIDLGCGMRKHAGAIGLDIAPIPGSVDILGDVTRTPFRDSCADRVYASHIVEHLDDLPAFMAEIWRISRHDALVYFRFPHASSLHTAWTDPTHRRALTMETFEYFAPETLQGVLFGYYHTAQFRVVRRRITFSLNAEKPYSGSVWLPSHNRARRVTGRILDALANRSNRTQYICERFWGPLVGMEEGHVWLRAIKSEPRL